MTNHVAICTLRRFVCFVDSGCLAPASMAPESHVGYPSTHDNTRQVDSHSVRKCSQNVHFLKFCFKLETQIWQSVSIWQRDEKRVMKREKALCITFQNGFSHFNLWTWSSSSRDVRRKKSAFASQLKMQIQKAPWFLNLRRFWRLVFPTDYLRHGDFTGLRRLMGSPCTLYTVTLIDTVKKRSKWERQNAFLKGSVQSKGWKVGRRGLPSRSVLALHSEFLSLCCRVLLQSDSDVHVHFVHFACHPSGCSEVLSALALFLRSAYQPLIWLVFDLKYQTFDAFYDVHGRHLMQISLHSLAVGEFAAAVRNLSLPG